MLAVRIISFVQVVGISTQEVWHCLFSVRRFHPFARSTFRSYHINDHSTSLTVPHNFASSFPARPERNKNYLQFQNFIQLKNFNNAEYYITEKTFILNKNQSSSKNIYIFIALTSQTQPQEINTNHVTPGHSTHILITYTVMQCAITM